MIALFLAAAAADDCPTVVVMRGPSIAVSRFANKYADCLTSHMFETADAALNACASVRAASLAEAKQAKGGVKTADTVFNWLDTMKRQQGACETRFSVGTK